MNFLKKYYLHIACICILIIAFAHNWSISLWDQDEAAYAGIAKNMVETNNWLIPEFMWSEIHRKPPLHFWDIAISYNIFGINEFAVRFPSTIFILLTYFFVFYWGKKIFSGNTSLVGTLVLSTTLLVPVLAKVSVTDATLLFFSTLAALSVIRLLQERSLKFTLIFWFAFAGALLIKGPPIIIFTGIFVVLLFIFHPGRKNLLRLHPWFFLPIAIAPLFLWGYLTTLRDGGAFVNWMYDWYIAKRVGGSVLGQSGPPGMHAALITGFFIPYFMFLPKAFWNGIIGIKKKEKEDLLLGAWFVAGWLIYEFSPSKLPAYCIVAHVPLALLIGKRILHYTKENSTPNKALQGVQFTLLVLITTALSVASFVMDLSLSLKITLITFNAVMILGIVMVMRLREKIPFSYSIIGLNFVFLFVITVVILPQIDVFKDAPRRVAYYVKENANPESHVVLANKKGSPPSLPFYHSLYFDEISDEEDFIQLIDFYYSPNPYVLVLNLDLKEQFEAHDPSLEFEEISAFYVDRKGLAAYYVLMNQSATVK